MLLVSGPLTSAAVYGHFLVVNLGTNQIADRARPMHELSYLVGNLQPMGSTCSHIPHTK